MRYTLSEILDEKYAHDLDDVKAVGIDIGSRGAKAVLLYDGKLFAKVVPSDISSRETAKELLESLLKEARISENDIHGIVGTGYGNVAMDFGDIPFRPVTEITCHAMGAHYLHAGTQTVIDIGGQDSKAIRVDSRNGKVIDFIMNDKCAAGTGRFLEKVAQILGLDLDELGPCACGSKNPAQISSQCVVFAESEVISLRATGMSKEDIVYGIHLASARRVLGLLRKTGITRDILFTGGVSNNTGMRRALEETLKEPVTKTKFDTIFAGALGAAIYVDR